jgi:predicted ester cyclase
MLKMLQSFALSSSAIFIAFAAAQASWAGPKENIVVVKNYFAAISGKDKPVSRLNTYVSDEELKKHVQFFEAAFPHYVLVSEDLVAQDDRVAVRARFQGTHAGDLMGIAPTGKSVDVPFIIIYRMADGKITEHWMSIDQLDLLKQLGVAK